MLLQRVRVEVGRPAVDVRIAGGRVVEIGDLTTGESTVSAEEIVDCGGGYLLPGFVDAHLHMAQWALSRRRVDVTSAASAADTVGMLVRASPGITGIVRAQGFRGALWAEDPHKDMLEAAMPGRRVAIISMDLHTTWLSPALMADIGVEDDTGVFHDQHGIEVQHRIDEHLDDDMLDGYILDATDDLARRGITSVLDFEYDDNLDAWSRRVARRRPGVRVSASVWPAWLDEAIAAGRRTGDSLTDVLRMGPLKIMADGSLNTRTACCHDAYPDSDATDAHGSLLVEFSELVELMTRAVGAGIAPAVHAIGDRANTVVLDAFEAALGVTGPGAATRPGALVGARIEHAQQIRVEDLPRFARAGLVASVQPQHAMTDRDVADVLWAGRSSRAYAYGSLHAHGARLQFGSDAPVSPPEPLSAVADAVWRTDDGRPPWLASESVPLDVALAAVSGGRTTVEVGSPADLVVLAEHPSVLGNADLRAAVVTTTVCSGSVTFSG